MQRYTPSVQKSWSISGELWQRRWQQPTSKMTLWSLWILWSSHAGRTRWSRVLTAPSRWRTARGGSPLSSSLWLPMPDSPCPLLHPPSRGWEEAVEKEEEEKRRKEEAFFPGSPCRGEGSPPLFSTLFQSILNPESHYRACFGPPPLEPV